MTEETKKALEAFVLQIIEAAKTGAAWTADQAPALVQEWLRWQIAEGLLFITALSIVGMLLAYGSRFCWQKKRAEPRSDWEAGGIAFMIAGFASLIPLFVTILGVVKIFVAPRVVVFEKFIQIIK